MSGSNVPTQVLYQYATAETVQKITAKAKEFDESNHQSKKATKYAGEEDSMATYGTTSQQNNEIAKYDTVVLLEGAATDFCRRRIRRSYQPCRCVWQLPNCIAH